MISVDDALAALLALVDPLETEDVPLIEAAGRYLPQPLAARLTQPPFDASAMDGYAVLGPVRPGDRLTVIGEAAAGHGFNGSVKTGEAVRIFTGAPVPSGADRIIIQEDVTRDGTKITLGENLDAGPYIRPAGGDFAQGDTLAPRRLRPVDVSLAGAMGHGTLPVTRKPVVALIATGDELVPPGVTPGPDQIVASNGYGLHALLSAAGAEVRMMPIAADTKAALGSAFRFARGADLIVTIGGASVGDHDLVADVAADQGLERSFYKIAMRPGKPLMAGRLRGAAMVGLPGNPVSAMVCGHVFLLPMIRRMTGDPKPVPTPQRAPLAHDIDANGPRAHYMRAQLTEDGLRIAERQDSSLLSVLSDANVLAIRPPHDKPRTSGEFLDILHV